MWKRADRYLRLSLRIGLLVGTCLGGVAHAATAAADAAAATGAAGSADLAARSASDDAGPIGGHVPSDSPRRDTESLYLVATLNGTPTDQFVQTTRKADGSLAFRADDLRALRLRLPATFGADDLVPAAKLPEITFNYDEARQALDVQAPDHLIKPFLVGIDNGREALNLKDVKPLSGLLINYGVYATVDNGQTTATGTLEADAMTRFGTFVTTGMFASDNRYSNKAFLRQDSYWRYIDPKNIRSYTIGDFNSNAQTWTTAVRMAGVQISSAFEQRPDLVTNALPQFSGSAALPSTVDLYINQQKIYSGDVPSGPFDLRELPYAANGNVRLVTTDANGRQITITKPYYYVQGQIRKGLLEYSLDVGAPRLGYGTESLLYDDVVFASGNVRYGLARNLTLEASSQFSSDGLEMGGVGVVASLWGRGALHASLAGSHYEGMTGGKYALRFEGSAAGLRFFASTERTFSDYFDLGRVATVRSLKRNDYSVTVVSDIANTAQARINDQAGVSFQPWFDKTSISLSYNHVVSGVTDNETANLSLSRSLGSHVSMFFNGYANLNSSHSYGGFLTLTFRPTRRTYATTEYDNSSGKSAWNLNYASTSTAQQNQLGWGMSYHGAEGSASTESAYANYRASQAYVQARVDTTAGAWRGELDVEGSILAAGGGVFPANQVSNGFVIVENGGPHVEVMQGGVRLARTDGGGRALLPNVTPYEPTHFFIDPVSLPDGWEPKETERVAVTGFKQGAIVDFGAKPVHGATITLLGKDGKPIAPGYQVQLDGGDTATVGYEGVVYLQGLKAQNRLTVDFGVAGTCSASFAYDIHTIADQRIGPVLCQ